MSYQYKPITLPWLTRMPTHWDLVRNKVLLHETKTTVGSEHTKYQLLSLTKGGVIIRDISSGKGKFPSDFGTYKTVDEGQIIFCLFDIDETPRTVGLSKQNGMITGAYDVFSVDGVNPRYLEYYYISLDDAKAMRPLYTGLRKVIIVNTFLQTHFPLPPRDEQDQIVRYLDWKVSQINRLISAKRRQVALLQEQKQALIREAVRNKWSTRRLKTFLTESKEVVGEHSAEYDLLSLTKNGVIIRDVSSGKGKFPSDFGTYKVVYPGHIIFCLFDVDETPRTVGLSNNNGMITGAYDVFEVNGIEPKFLEYYFIAIDDIKGLKPLYTGLRKVVNKDRFFQMQIPLPLDVEQKDIVVYLDIRCANIEKITNKLNDEIALFTEYRTSLISDVVTGKLDVRGVVVPEYKSVEEMAGEYSEISDDDATETEAES